MPVQHKQTRTTTTARLYRLIKNSNRVSNQDGQSLKHVVRKFTPTPVANHPNISKALNRLPATVQSKSVRIVLGRIQKENETIFKTIDGFEYIQGVTTGLKIAGKKLSIELVDLSSTRAAIRYRKEHIERTRSMQLYEAMQLKKVFTGKKDKTALWQNKLRWPLILKLLNGLDDVDLKEQEKTLARYKRGIKRFVKTLPQHGRVFQSAPVAALAIRLHQQMAEKTPESILNGLILKALVAQSPEQLPRVANLTIDRALRDIHAQGHGYVSELGNDASGALNRRQAYHTAMDCLVQMLEETENLQHMLQEMIVANLDQIKEKLCAM